MADAGTPGASRDIRKRVSRIDKKGWRTVCSVCGVKDLFFAASILLQSLHAPCTSVRSAHRCARPDDHPDAPKPDYFFLWLYALLSLLPPAMETPATSHRPVIAILVLRFFHFCLAKEKRAGAGDRSPF